MPRWLKLSEYHWAALVMGLAVSASVLAWLSFGLINLAMANVDFLTRHGLMALHEGGLLQLVGIGLRSAIALAAYVLFKAMETELIHRWRAAGK